MKMEYISKAFRASTLGIIRQASRIIKGYVRQGLDLTVRQLYYRFIALDLFPNSWIDPVYNAKRGLPPDTKNTDKNYKRLGGIINNARLAGFLDWNHIVDRTRFLKKLSHWDSPTEIIESCAASFRINKWADQKYRVEVWIEKDALVGVIQGVCEKWDVPYFSCRGYVSQSAMWEASQRMLEYSQATVLLHLGDHDPSGLDMTRDIIARQTLFENDCICKRLALTMDQIDELNPPPNPAKLSDARAGDYIAEYGDECWELDALEPAYMSNLIEEAIKEHLDMDAWDKAVAKEEEYLEWLQGVVDNWEQVVEFMQTL